MFGDVCTFLAMEKPEEFSSAAIPCRLRPLVARASYLQCVENRRCKATQMDYRSVGRVARKSQ